MGAQRSLSLLILLLLTFQEMMPSEAVMCPSPSRLFHGPCFSSRNCLAICEKEGFKIGECKMFKCVCAKDCKSSGGEEPGEGPPEEGGNEPGDGPPEQGGEPGQGPPEEGGDEPGDGPPEQGGDDDGEEPVAHPPKKAGGGHGKPPGPPEQGGDDDGEEPVAHPPKKAGGGHAKPPAHSRKYLLPSN